MRELIALFILLLVFFIIMLVVEKQFPTAETEKVKQIKQDSLHDKLHNRIK